MITPVIGLRVAFVVSRERVSDWGQGGQDAMADKSKHENIDGGRQSHPTCERLQPQGSKRGSGPSGARQPARGQLPEEGPELFEHLFQASGDGIILHEVLSSPARERILEVNECLCRMLDSTRAEILALAPLESFGAEAREALTELVHEAGDRDRVLFETTLAARDRRIPVEVHSRVLRFQGRRLLLSSLRDITERRQREERSNRWKSRLEEEVRVQTDQLQEAVGRLQNEVSRRVQTERELRRRSRMLEAFFVDTITPLAFLDRQFCFIRVNEAYARSAGKSAEYFVGRNYFALYPHPAQQVVFEEAVRNRQSHRACAEPFTYPDQPQRGVTYWDWRLTPLCGDSGDVQCLVLSLEDVTQRQNALREMEHRTGQLRKLTGELLQAEDRERRRLAEILHDDLQQTLAAAKFQLGLLDSRIRHDAELVEIVGQVRLMLKDAVERSRSLSHELGPAVLAQSGLDETFEWLARQMERKHGLVVRVQTRGRVDSSSEPVRTFLYRAAQEILFNVVKHARVSEARLRLQRVRDQVWLTISDKGRGFDLGALTQTGGFGLLKVRERAELLGGRMRIRSAAGRGSTFLIAVPDTGLSPGEDHGAIIAPPAPAVDCG